VRSFAESSEDKRSGELVVRGQEGDHRGSCGTTRREGREEAGEMDGESEGREVSEVIEVSEGMEVTLGRSGEGSSVWGTETVTVDIGGEGE
jgi:hypothetical protein